jgi:iron complex outermembrane receptor protein
VVRDELQIVPDRLLVSAGIRLDFSTYRRLEFQPSVRMLYTPSARQSLWLAASRAARVPSRLDRDIRYEAFTSMMGEIPLTTVATGSRAMRPEREHSLEAGYRLQSGQRWSVDTSIFWSHYDKLRTLSGPMMPDFSFNGTSLVATLPLTMANLGTGRNYGGEIWATWQVRHNWRLIPSYSYLNEARWLPAPGSSLYVWDGSPLTLPHQGILRSQHNLSRNVQFDMMFKANSPDRQFGIPGAFVVGARVAWRPTRTGEFSFAVQNLADRRIIESYAEGPNVAIPTRRTFTFEWRRHL